MEVSFEDGDNFIRNMVTVRMPHGPTQSPPARKLERAEELPVSIEDLALDLRVDDEEADEATLTRILRGAAGFLERRTGYVIIPGTYQVDMPGWWFGGLEIMRGPLRSLTSIAYLADATTWTAADLAGFYVDEGDKSFTVNPLRSFVRPTLWSELMRVRLTFEAGFAADDESGAGLQHLDDGLRTCLIALCAHYYQNRELFAAGKIAEVEMGAGNLLAAFRQFW